MAKEIKVSEKEIEILAHRLLPVMKNLFADETVKQEFREWISKQENNN